jgi:hypothetical protein
MRTRKRLWLASMGLLVSSAIAVPCAASAAPAADGDADPARAAAVEKFGSSAEFVG